MRRKCSSILWPYNSGRTTGGVGRICGWNPQSPFDFKCDTILSTALGVDCLSGTLNRTFRWLSGIIWICATFKRGAAAGFFCSSSRLMELLSFSSVGLAVAANPLWDRCMNSIRRRSGRKSAMAWHREHRVMMKRQRELWKKDSNGSLVNCSDKFLIKNPVFAQILHVQINSSKPAFHSRKSRGNFFLKKQKKTRLHDCSTFERATVPSIDWLSQRHSTISWFQFPNGVGSGNCTYSRAQLRTGTGIV